ncbi:hypothetical protein JTF06_06755 [Desemzia sp. RIT804]|uniref:hypothetical protein n=1 Tax=Desemzia sp. RIT 804 TaxID=2810209 RepID=UPI0019518F0B|nr:hypothetical protein [Desemzia sp. RIT 804]MBM6614586.1 hypothetical protein [Desemzia sp. RIT 804]
MEEKKQYIEIWGDVVEIHDLVRSIVISAISTMGLYFLAPSGNRTLQLFFGLAGASIGFIISGLLTKPKRIIDSEDTKHHHTG